jgi:hypothetical protein
VTLHTPFPATTPSHRLVLASGVASGPGCRPRISQRSRRIRPLAPVGSGGGWVDEEREKVHAGENVNPLDGTPNGSIAKIQAGFASAFWRVRGGALCIQIAAICGYGCPDVCTNLGSRFGWVRLVVVVTAPALHTAGNRDAAGVAGTRARGLG